MIDTSKQGFEYAGVILTDKQYELLQLLNIGMLHSDRKSIPVFDIVMLLKILNVLPESMSKPLPKEEDFENYIDYLQAVFGRKRE